MGGLNLSNNGNLIMEAREIEDALVEVMFSWTRRGGNQVIHALARRAYALSNSTVWLYVVPSFISTDVSWDISFV